MRHTFLLLLSFLILNTVSSQTQADPDTPKMEVKANAFNLIVFKSPEVNFEYLLNQESGIGASILVNLEETPVNDFVEGPYYNEKFALTPYYRRYFSSKYAWGFFLEAFSMLNVQGDYDGYYYFDENDPDNTLRYRDDTSTNLAFGIAVGGKFVSQRGFVFEFFGGVGRNIITGNEDISVEFVPRLGINLGYRF